MKRNIRFIINPRSGGKNKNNLPQQIGKYFNGQHFNSEIIVTRSASETILSAADAVEKNFDAVIGCGGDGTVNNIAGVLMNTNVALGIIPRGSGNGFSRDLGIPFNLRSSLAAVSNFNIRKIDLATVNDQPFINVCGVGFDAHVSGLFQHSETRGFFTYAKIVLAEFTSYKLQQFTVTLDGVTFSRSAFLIAVSNGSQFGNNARIAPSSLPDDGLLNITILKSCGWTDVPSLAYRLFTGTFHKHRLTESFTAREISIFRGAAGIVNVDGEPVKLDASLKIKVLPLSLKVIIP